VGPRPVPPADDDDWVDDNGMRDVVEEAIALIRRRGGRSTTPRRVVLEALLAADDAHRSAEELAAQVQSAYPKLNESTVYRTLELLEELGVVSHVHLGHGPSQWYLSQRRQHWYLTCAKCGAVETADPDLFATLAAGVESRTGFAIDAGHFAITGTCRACRFEADPAHQSHTTSGSTTPAGSG
jgi:Fur family transcriptional regulator, ferric uptake regulator